MVKRILIKNTGCSVGKFFCEDLQQKLMEYDIELLVSGDMPLSRNIDITEQAQDLKSCHAVLIFACVCTAAIEETIEDYIKKLIVLNPKLKIILTGCMTSKKNIFDQDIRVIQDASDQKILATLDSFQLIKNKKKQVLKTGAVHSVFIQDGCHKACSYCVVPGTRGHRSKYVETANIMSQIKMVERSGHGSITLCGPCIGSWCDKKTNMKFNDLLKSILEKTKLHITSLEIHPHYINEEFGLLFSNDKIDRRISIPIQSGSERILKLMNRGYGREDIIEIITTFKKRSPNAVIKTDIIIGFPTETKKDFYDTVKLLLRLPIAEVYVIRYSVRPNTKAATMPQIQEKEKNRRLNDISKILKENNIKIHIPDMLSLQES